MKEKKNKEKVEIHKNTNIAQKEQSAIDRKKAKEMKKL